ncbi:MAG TPA: hypothetical protein VJX67_17825, partial [Blastocatellia bacterium]|nr:hypothetical protein [Blastocatellia bacterium]
GNPPYIRQEVMGSSDKTRIRSVLGSNAGADARRRGRQKMARLTSKGNGRPARDDNRRSLNGVSRVLSEETGPANQQSAPDRRIYFPEWSGRSDIYVYFFAHGARFLKPGGRLVFITASSWLDVEYGSALQEFMLRNFKVLAIVESGVESFFEGASVNTAITVLERDLATDGRDQNIVRFVQLRRPLDQVLAVSASLTGAGSSHGLAGPQSLEFARWLETAQAGDSNMSLRIRTVVQQELRDTLIPSIKNAGQTSRVALPSTAFQENRGRSGITWGKYLRAGDVLFRILDKSRQRLLALAKLASVRFGVKTGANDFFYVRPKHDAGADKVAEADSLRRLEEIASVRRGMTTGANEFFYVKPLAARDAGADLTASTAGFRQRAGAKRDETTLGSGSDLVLVEDGTGQTHQIESRFLAPVVFSLKELRGIVIPPDANRRCFFNCSSDGQELKGSKALDYIRFGEDSGFHRRPTCRNRRPWYSIVREMKPAPLIFPSKVGERWLVAINSAGMYEDKKLYGVFPGPGVPLDLLAAVLNSTWARYYTEITCRQLTGAQAIADIDVRVAEQILLPDLAAVGDSQAGELSSALDELCARPIVSIFEETSMADRRRLDDVVLKVMGFDEELERREVLEELYDAATNLVRRRLGLTMR